MHHPTSWTAADHAELRVLTYELARGQAYHREHCEACRPDPCPILQAYRAHKATCAACEYRTPCPERTAFVQHGDSCARCNPCPGMRRAIEVVADWHHARELLSEAEWLRAERDALEAVA